MADKFNLNFNDFKYKEKFLYMCELFPNIKKERLEIINSNKENINKEGLIYAMIYNDNIIKIGQTILTFEGRLSSYNCGKKAFRENGTCSTTNFFVLQTLLNLKNNIKVYALIPEMLKFDFMGNILEISPSKRIEEVILIGMKKTYGFLPILNTQT